MEQLMDALRNSTRMFVIVAVLGAVYNLISGLFFTDAGKKRRFRATCVISLITLVLFAVLYLVVLPIISDVSLVINGLSVLYTLLSFIFALVTMIKGSEDKANRSFALSRMFAFATALLFLVFVFLRQYDLIVFKDELEALPETKFPSLALMEGALSNNVFHGFAIAMVAIAAIGTFALTLLNLWKQDKHKFFTILSVVFIIVYLVFPAYKATYTITPTSEQYRSDYFADFFGDPKKGFLPETISISGVSLLLGINTRISANIPLTFLVFGGIFAFVICQMLEYKYVGSGKVRNAKAISLMIIGLAIVFTSAFATMSIGDTFAVEENAIREFAKYILFKNSESGLVPVTIGVPGVVSTIGLLLVVCAILTIFKPFCKLLKRYRYILMSAVSVIAILMLVTTNPLYKLPEKIIQLNFTGAMLGVQGRSYFNILWVVAIVSVVLGVISGVLAQADDQSLSKFFRRVSALFLMVAGVIILLGEQVIVSSLAPQVKTLRAFFELAGKDATVKDMLLKSGLIFELLGEEATVSDAFVTSGLMLIASSIIMVAAGWKNFFVGFARFVSEGAGRRFLATFGAIALLVVVAIAMWTGSIRTQVLLAGSKEAVNIRYDFIDILMGTAVPEGTLGGVIRIILFAILGLTAIATISMLFGDIIYKKKAKIQTFAFVLIVVTALVLILTSTVCSLIVKDINPANKVTFGQSLLVIGLIVLAIGILTMYKTAFSVFKGAGEFIVNNVALTAAILSFVFIILYMLGILTNPLK